MTYFVVVNEQGPSWDTARTMREQAGWSEHAAFVNALVAEGFVVLAGPIGAGERHRALLLVHAPDEPTARIRLLEDPWMDSGILRLGAVEPFQLLASQDRLDAVLAEITGPARRPSDGVSSRGS
jgi:hypothetical protein